MAFIHPLYDGNSAKTQKKQFIKDWEEKQIGFYKYFMHGSNRDGVGVLSWLLNPEMVQKP